MLVKASGASLGSVTAADFVELETAPLTALLDDPAGDDAAVSRAFAPVEERTGRRPSVEAMLHAVCLELGGAHAVGHTHPVPVVALLCSRHAEALATEMLFPDQIVVLGRRPLFVPYVDPGLALARRVRDDLELHVARHGEPPKAIYLGNHGLFALGRTPEHVLQITAMAVKASRVLAGALAVGGASALADARRTGSTRGRTSTTGARRSPRAGTGRRGMPEGLDGKVAVVTGASSGIGRAVAQELMRRGADVVIAARSRERVEEAAAALGCTRRGGGRHPRRGRRAAHRRDDRDARRASTSWWRTRACTSAATSGRATPRRSTAC